MGSLGRERVASYVFSLNIDDEEEACGVLVVCPHGPGPCLASRPCCSSLSHTFVRPGTYIFRDELGDVVRAPRGTVVVTEAPSNVPAPAPAPVEIGVPVHTAPPAGQKEEEGEGVPLAAAAGSATRAESGKKKRRGRGKGPAPAVLPPDVVAPAEETPLPPPLPPACTSEERARLLPSAPAEAAAGPGAAVDGKAAPRAIYKVTVKTAWSRVRAYARERGVGALWDNHMQIGALRTVAYTDGSVWSQEWEPGAVWVASDATTFRRGVPP